MAPRTIPTGFVEIAPGEYARPAKPRLAAQINHEQVGQVEIYAPNKSEPCALLPNTIPKRDKAPALGGAGKGEEKSVQRIVVRITGYRVKPLDPDNFAGSVKDVIDGLRHAQLLHGDESWRIKLETEQVRVAHYKDEKTVVELEYPTCLAHNTLANPFA